LLARSLVGQAFEFSERSRKAFSNHVLAHPALLVRGRTCLSQHQPETPLRAVFALSKQLWPISEQLPKSVNGDRSCVATSLHRLSSVKRSIAMYNIASKVVELFQRSLRSSAVPKIVLKQPRKRCGNPQRWFTIS
jgi:hypothetical protein